METARVTTGYIVMFYGKKKLDAMNMQKDVFVKGTAQHNRIPKKKQKKFFPF
jgi:hypothetical protein